MADLSEPNNQHPSSTTSDGGNTRSGPPMEPIAICGMSMRLPGGIKDADEFWSALTQKRELKRPVPPDRFNIESFYSPYGKTGTIPNREAFYLDEEFGHFDSAFFTLSKEQLRHLDPQQRMLLELTQECLENAGEINWRGKRIGCYVGTFGEDWLDLGAKDTLDPSMYRAAGQSDFALSNRTSYEFDFRGPSMTIKSACSAAMLCLNEACWAIESRQCDAAIVAGTNLIMTPTMTVAIGPAVLSPDGACKTFDADANGYARGEAINAIFVKRLSDAVRDGNAIRAVIRGIGVNSDGQTSAGLMPSHICQESLIRDTYAQANLPFSETGLFECHGTGTRVGDPIEANVVSKIFGDYGIHIGATKPNFGHSEGASAITSIIKAILALEKKTIPPNMRFSTPNPKIDFGCGRLVVPTEVTSWPAGRKARISVNSFGITGANGHVILDSADSFMPQISALKDKALQKIPQLLVLSANLEQSLSMLKNSYRDFLSQRCTGMYDLAHTLGVKRRHHKYRSFCVANENDTELNFSPTISITAKPAKLVFVFTGQGASWPRMAVELLAQNRAFSETMTRLEEVLSNLTECEFSLREELACEKAARRLREAEISQPLSVAIQICLCNALATVGVVPGAVVGHSSGEIAAAYAAGAITEAEAIMTAFYRGQAIKADTSLGAMVTIGLGRDSLDKLSLQDITVACENSPANVTISGTKSKIETAMDIIEEAHPECLIRRLQVSKAYHSHHMTGVGILYERMLQDRVRGSGAKLPYFSSMLGRKMHESEILGPSYWRKNLESPVLFRSAVDQIISDTGSSLIFVEIGPHPTLAGSLIQTCAEHKTEMHYASFMRRACNSSETFLSGLGLLYQLGTPIDFQSLTPEGRTLTDLPSYPWHHDVNVRHWNETRLSREWRFRKHPHHDLLGSRSGESSSIEPSWRNILRSNDVPWIKDHQVGPEIVFPFAAYCAMAGEAIQQIHDRRGGFTVRQVVAKSALVIQPSDAVEMITTLRPARLTDSLESAWFEFTITSYHGTQWTKHCSGSVKLGRCPLRTTPKDFSGQTFARKVDTKSWYTSMARIGLHYGEEFQGLRSISADVRDHKAAATVRNHSNETESPYQLHPSTIDSALQLIGVAASKGLSKNVNYLLVPTRVEEMYIGTSNDDVRFSADAEISTRGTVSGTVIGSCGSEQVFHMTDLRLAPLEDLGSERGADPHAAAELVWAPDIELLESSRLSRPERDVESEVSLLEKLVRLCSAETLSLIREAQAERSYPPQYLDWLQSTAASDVTQVAEHTDRSCLDEIKMLASELSTKSVAHISRAILKTLDAGTEILSEQLSSEFQESISISPETMQLLRLLAHSNPLLKVLQLENEHGTLNESLLKILSTDAGQRCYSTYTVARTTASPLPDERQLKGPHRVDYAVLDISQDPMLQGFSPQSFDLIVIGASLLPSLSTEAFTNVRTLLRRTGSLIMQTYRSEMSWSTYVLGRQDIWWQHEAQQKSSASFRAFEDWNAQLRGAGLSGIAFFDNSSPFYLNNTIFARASSATALPRSIVLLCFAKEDAASRVVASTLRNQGVEVEEVITLNEISETSLEDKAIVSIIDLQGPSVLDGISPQNFALLQRLVQNSMSFMLWLTPPSQIVCPDPNYATILGLARTARTELEVSFCTLELDLEEPGADQAILKVLSKFKGQLNSRETDALLPNFEYAFHQGSIQIPRFRPKHLHESLLQLPGANDNLNLRAALQVGTPGRLDSLHWAFVPNVRPLLPSYVDIQVKAVGVNFKDVLISMGIIDNSDDGLGVEGSGIVTQVGSDVKNLKPSDRVMFCGPGSYANSVRGPEAFVCKIPDSISFDEAATMPCVYLTVLYGLRDLGRLRKGESILIHSGCGGVGLAAIQLCQMIGAQIFVTVGSGEKVQHLIQTYGIPRHHIFNSRDSSFYPELMRETAGRGVDIVLNSLSGELLHASWKCVAPFGRMIEIGKRDQIEFGKLDLDLFAGNRTYCGLSLTELCEEREDIIKRLFSELSELLAKRILKPITPITTFPAKAVEETLRYMQKGQHIGKIVVQMPDDIEKLPTSVQARKLLLDPHASYLLIGGLGGLGVAIARWMVENGAKHLVFISRSAGRSEEHCAFLQELNAMGCAVKAVSGDVADPSVIERVVTKTSPPIKGVVQASMVLKDQSIQNMTFEEWIAATNPKVIGTWNLHNALRQPDLDFFILLSSISGVIGQHGQSNYNAANTFLDAFVQYRHSLHLAASVLDIGAVGDKGVLYERPSLLHQMRTSGAHILYEQEILDSMHWAIDNSKPWQRQHEYGPHQPEITQRGGLTVGLRSTTSLRSSSNLLPWNRDSRMAMYHNMGSASPTVKLEAASSSNTSPRLLSTLAKIHERPAKELSDPATAQIFAEEIGKKIFSMLLKPTEEIDIKTSLTAMGLDSLTGIEMKRWWRDVFRTDVNVLQVANAGTLEGLGKLAVQGLKLKLLKS